MIKLNLNWVFIQICFVIFEHKFLSNWFDPTHAFTSLPYPKNWMSMWAKWRVCWWPAFSTGIQLYFWHLASNFLRGWLLVWILAQYKDGSIKSIKYWNWISSVKVLPVTTLWITGLTNSPHSIWRLLTRWLDDRLNIFFMLDLIKFEYLYSS